MKQSLFMIILALTICCCSNNRTKREKALSQLIDTQSKNQLIFFVKDLSCTPCLKKVSIQLSKVDEQCVISSFSRVSLLLESGIKLNNIKIVKDDYLTNELSLQYSAIVRYDGINGKVISLIYITPKTVKECIRLIY